MPLIDIVFLIFDVRTFRDQRSISPELCPRRRIEGTGTNFISSNKINDNTCMVNAGTANSYIFFEESCKDILLFCRSIIWKPLTKGHLWMETMNKPLAMIELAAIAFLFTLSMLPEALAIDVYHFLVQYKNGRVAEKIATHSEKSYKDFFEGYVANVALLDKQEYSLHQFIQTFGEKNYHRFMTGYFGFGLEEEIIFQRNAGGLGVNPRALPPPDKKSKMLAKELDRILQGNRQADVADPLDQSAQPNRVPPLPGQSNDSGFLANCSLQERRCQLAG